MLPIIHFHTVFGLETGPKLWKLFAGPNPDAVVHASFSTSGRLHRGRTAILLFPAPVDWHRAWAVRTLLRRSFYFGVCCDAALFFLE